MFWRCLLTALFLAFITTNLKAMPFDSTDDAEGRASSCPEDGLYPNYYNCSTFYQCSNGIAYVYNCPEGTIWNVDNKTCDWPYETECVTYPRDENI